MTPATQRAIDFEAVARFTARVQKLLEEADAVRPALDRLNEASLRSAGRAWDMVDRSLDHHPQHDGGLWSMSMALRDVVGEIEVVQ